eukprot:COSAG06_NODE_36657_length_444_cov_1.098551_1_plen_90_part_10
MYVRFQNVRSRQQSEGRASGCAAVLPFPAGTHNKNGFHLQAQLAPHQPWRAEASEARPCAHTYCWDRTASSDYLYRLSPGDPERYEPTPG